MKKILFVLSFLFVSIIYAQDVTYVDGLAFKNYTTVELNAISKKVEGDTYYDTNKKQLVFWNGDSWASGTGEDITSVKINNSSPTPWIGVAVGTSSELASAEASILSDTPANGVTLMIEEDEGDISGDYYIEDMDFTVSGSTLNVTTDYAGLPSKNYSVTLPTGGGSITLDAVPTDGSTNGVESNGIFDELEKKPNLIGNNDFTGEANWTQTVSANIFSSRNFLVKDTPLPTGTTNGGAASVLKSGEDNGELVWLGKTGSGAMIFDNSNITSARTYTMPNKSGTVALLDDISSGGVSQTTGTFTPVLVGSTGGSATLTGVGSYAAGSYVKTGKVIEWTINAQVTSVTGTLSGNLNINIDIAGEALAPNKRMPINVGYFSMSPSATDFISVYGMCYSTGNSVDGGSWVDFYYRDSAGKGTTLYPVTGISNGTSICISGTFITQ